MSKQSTKAGVTVTAAEIKRISLSARQAITTRTSPATDTRDTRIRARCDARSISVPWDHGMGVSDNHAAAALRLHKLLGRDEHSELVMGAIGDGYVFVEIRKGGL